MAIWQVKLNNLFFFLIIVLLVSLIAKPVFAASLPNYLTMKQLQQLAQKIELNETAAKEEFLTYWSENESFPSFGIGHFIWLPENSNKPFKETFPELVTFLSKKSDPPNWLITLSPFTLPWQNKQQFYQEFNNAELTLLRQWLGQTKHLQAEFIYIRFLEQLNLAKQSLPKKQLEMFKYKLNKIIAQPAGLFAIIDYANFKGLGNNTLEVYYKNGNAVGWGLIDVVLAMPEQKEGLSYLDDFIKSAKFVLTRRTQLAPKYQNEQRWLKGWYYRLDKYNDATLVIKE